MQKNTIFDLIIAGKAPAEVVYKDEDVFAFKDVNPMAPIHVLVIPTRRADSFKELADMDASYVGRYIQGVAKVATMLGLDDPGYRVVYNTGKDANQSVDYLHAHILGGRQLSWPPG